jgi:hypothetical protein
MEDHFFSMNKLVEFGLSMAIAQQMVQSMNQTMEQQKVAGVMQPMHTGHLNPTEKIYYVAIDNKETGPYNETELSRLIANKKIDKNTLIWMPGMKNWTAAENIPELLRLVALQPPKLPNK